MDRADQALEKQIRQVLDWQRQVDASSKPENMRDSQLISAICEGIIPVIKKHVLREIAKGTEHLKRRVTMLEINQKMAGPVKAVKRVGPVKVIKRVGPVKCW